MIETPSVAFRQSSGESRSPEISSTCFPARNRLSVSFKRSSRVESRMKQRRLKYPYSRRVSTTFVPMKPFDPVTRMRSHGLTICWRVTVKSLKSYSVTTSTGMDLERDRWQVNRGPACIRENEGRERQKTVSKL